MCFNQLFHVNGLQLLSHSIKRRCDDDDDDVMTISLKTYHSTIAKQLAQKTTHSDLRSPWVVYLHRNHVQETFPTVFLHFDDSVLFSSSNSVVIFTTLVRSNLSVLSVVKHRPIYQLSCYRTHFLYNGYYLCYRAKLLGYGTVVGFYAYCHHISIIIIITSSFNGMAWQLQTIYMEQLIKTYTRWDSQLMV